MDWMTPEKEEEFHRRADAMIAQDKLSDGWESEIDICMTGFANGIRSLSSNASLTEDEVQAKARRFAIRDILLTVMQREHFAKKREADEGTT